VPQREEDRDAPRLQLEVTVEVDAAGLESRPMERQGRSREAGQEPRPHGSY